MLLSWALAALTEFVVIGVTCARLFAGNWELLVARRDVLPIALAMLAPAAIVVVVLGHLVANSGESARARRELTGTVGILGALVAFGVSQGRHFASVAVRAPFVALVGALFAAVTYALAPRAARLPKSLAVILGIAASAGFWLADVHVLPRLYPAFHALLLAGLLVAAALPFVAWRTPRALPVARAEYALSSVGLLATLAALAWTPTAARAIGRSDNLRIVLDENAPLLGRAVHVAAWIAPPPAIDPGPAVDAPHVGEVPRALDWSGDDLLLISVDALRADHLGAYGYPRPTTPNLDALAKTAALFEHAYCPTPHTSYSVTSMMTGKAMRPLLSLGLGADSETWAQDLRRYGYKTAAFYPPAVFYIDAERFTGFEQSGLGFEYKWVEFTSAEEKVHEVERYLAAHASPEPLFLWVHLFEPHEPYVAHAGYDFGGAQKRPVDAYDSEVAYADHAIGELLRVVRAQRPKVTVVVTADHGEEFGEHGGRYHGTTTYEEQVRVPLLIAGPGVVPRRIPTVVQTIDLLPTVLSALGIPRPARVRGRDLGALLAHKGGGAADTDPGLAYAETDDQTLLARGDDRLICARKLGACALYDVKDESESHDRAAAEPLVARELRAMTAGIERDQGRYERADVAWPDALRRGLQGEADAALDVAGLLDDASVVIRRKAAEVTFRLAAQTVIPQAKRALAKDEDEEVRRWASLSLVRMGEPPSPLAAALVKDGDKRWRRAAALAFAVAGDARGKTELAAWWEEEGPPHARRASALDTADAKELLSALAKIKDRDAVPALLASMDYVPLRPALAATLGAIGDPRARAPLLALFAHERYETARPAEARALMALGAGPELLPALTTFAGLPDPMPEAVAIAHAADLFTVPGSGGMSSEAPVPHESYAAFGPQGPVRLWVLLAVEGEVTASLDGVPLTHMTAYGKARAFDVERPVSVPPSSNRVTVDGPSGIQAAWLVPLLQEVPVALRPRLPDAGAPDAH